MSCIKKESHKKTDTVCSECLKEIDLEPVFPCIDDIKPELRAVLAQLTLQNQDLYTCWKSAFTHLRLEGKRLKIENVYYAFFKADIGNNTLKRTCCTIGCVNPYHRRSRFEASDIRQRVKSGFNNKLKFVEDVSNAEWERLP
jgi:hypothetical protein